jgi:hypothetical protein
VQKSNENRWPNTADPSLKSSPIPITQSSCH